MVKKMRSVLPALLVLLTPAFAVAQPSATLRLPVEPPDAAELEEEQFGVPVDLYDPSGTALGGFHDALRHAEAGTGQARVMVYGASHVAADFFTNVMREHLQERFGDAGHGFFMPVRAWRRYRHLGGPTVESSRNWESLRIRASSRDVDRLGVAGMAVDTDRAGAWGRIDTGSAPAGRFVVQYLRQPGGGSFDLKVDGRRVARIPTEAPEVMAGVYPIDGLEDGQHTLEVRSRGDGPVRLFGVSIERERAGVIVDTMGLNGARAASLLLWQEDLHREYLRRMSPDLVVLAYGTNESGDVHQPIEDYEADLLRVVGRLRGTVPEASCLLVGPSDRPRRERGEVVDRPRTHRIIEVQRRVSRAMGCAFFDLVAFGGGPLSMVRWAEHDPPYAQRDLVHFTGRAYNRLGDVLTGSILDGYEPPTVDPTPPGDAVASRD